MNYQQALDYLFSQLPMFHRIGAAAYKANLDNTIALSELAGLPYNSFRTIHIAGTNGKGSVSHMLASISQEAGLKTGLFTSPHLIDFRERIKVNGQMIDQGYIASFVTKYQKQFAQIKPSFFEMTFVLGMCWFRETNVDLAVIETGLGGRLDSTNVITPVLSVITNIGFDHMQFLGDSLEAIAGEKAGIIKPGIPVIIGESNPLTDPIFIKKAHDSQSKIVFADKQVKLNPVSNKLPVEPGSTENDHFDEKLQLQTPDGEIIESPLIGDYQVKNICTVLASKEFLQPYLHKPPAKIAQENSPGKEAETNQFFTEGIKNTIRNTGLLGRWQILSKSPLTICDIGHNTHSLPWVVKQIRKQKYNSLHFVLGSVNDKDIDNMLALLPINATYYFCKADIPRGLDAEILKEKASSQGLRGKSYSSVISAYEAAKQQALGNDMIFIGGSAFVVAEVLPVFNHR